MLNNSENRVQIIEPLLKRTELQVFNTARCSNQFDVFDPFGNCISVQLTDRRNSFLAEEPLDVCIKTGALKEAVAQKQHTIAIISGKKF